MGEKQSSKCSAANGWRQDEMPACTCVCVGMKNRDASSRRQIIVSIVGWQRLAARKLSRAIVQKDSSEKFPHTNESGHKAGLGEKEGSGSGLFTKCISCALHHFCCSVPGWDCVVLQFI